MKSLLVLPVSLLYGGLIYILRRKTLICIPRNGLLIASDFLEDFEPLKRAHAAGEFGDTKVLFVVDGIPLGERLWAEIRGCSAITIPRFPRVFRCVPGNRFAQRIYLSVGESSQIRRRRIGLPASVPPSQGLPLPASAWRLALDSGQERFTLMNCQRPELWASLRRASGTNPHLDYENWNNFAIQFPILENYETASKLLAAEGYSVVDLWKEVGNPVSLFSGESQMEGLSERDELQTWLFANCEVFLSGTSGAWWIAWALGKPTVVADSMWIHFDQPISMFVPMLLWDRQEKRLLKLSEMWRSKSSIRKSVLSAKGRLEVVRNTPEDIAAAVLELRDLSRNTREKNHELQNRVLQIARDAVGKSKPDSKLPLLSQSFLEKHGEILG